MSGANPRLAIRDQAADGMLQFLRYFSDEDLVSIAKTSTGGLIASSSPTEAISIITKYSDAASLLNRRRVKRDVMAQYLHDSKVQIQLPADRAKLCNYILQFWGVVGASVRSRTTEPEDNSNTSPSQEYGAKLSSTQFQGQNSAFSSQQQQLVPQFELPRQQTGQELAEQFTRWFYPKWNSLEDFTAIHFWQHCNLRVEVNQLDSGAPNIKEIFQDGPACCAFMRELITGEQLTMNPNLQDGLGVWGKLNPFGLAQIIVCGTVHKGGRPFGIFEQVFGLVKDPSSENNFKIQFSLIRFKGSGGLLSFSKAPTLAESSLGCLMIEEVEMEEDED